MPKTDFDNTLSSLDSKIAENKTKNKSIENELEKLKTFDASCFTGKSRFEEDGTQNYLAFQPIHRYFKVIAITKYVEYVSEWKSKGLSGKTIKSIATSDNSLNPKLSYYGSKIRVRFAGSCLKQPKITYTHGTIVNIYIVYEFGASGSNDSDPTWKYCLYGYGIGFDRKSVFSFPGGGFGQNVIILGVDMSSYTHIDNKKKDILILRKGPTQGLEQTLTEEKNEFD